MLLFALASGVFVRLKPQDTTFIYFQLLFLNTFWGWMEMCFSYWLLLLYSDHVCASQRLKTCAIYILSTMASHYNHCSDVLADMSINFQAAIGSSSSWSRHNAHTYITRKVLSCRQKKIGPWASLFFLNVNYWFKKKLFSSWEIKHQYDTIKFRQNSKCLE